MNLHPLKSFMLLTEMFQIYKLLLLFHIGKVPHDIQNKSLFIIYRKKCKDRSHTFQCRGLRICKHANKKLKVFGNIDNKN